MTIDHEKLRAAFDAGARWKDTRNGTSGAAAFAAFLAALPELSPAEPVAEAEHSPAVQKAMARYHAKVAELAAQQAPAEPVAWMWDEVVDPTGSVVNGKTVKRFATHWSTPPSYAKVTPLYAAPQALAEAREVEALCDLMHRDPDQSLYALLYPFVGDDGGTRALRMELAKWVKQRAAPQAPAEPVAEAEHSPAVQKAMARYHAKVAELAAQQAPAEAQEAFEASRYLNQQAAYYGGNAGQLDGVPFAHVAHICRVMRDRIAALTPKEPPHAD